MRVKPLSYRFFPRTNESYQGYLERLACDNGFYSALEMTKWYRAQGMQKTDAPITVLRVLTGHPDIQLEKIGLLRPKARDLRTFHLFGQQIPSWWVRPSKHCYICPLCINEIGSTKMTWQFCWARTCPIHAVNLIAHCAACDKAITHGEAVRSACKCGEHYLPTPATVNNQLTFDAAIESCINARKIPTITSGPREFLRADGSQYYDSVVVFEGHWANYRRER